MTCLMVHLALFPMSSLCLWILIQNPSWMNHLEVDCHL
jgi:hypothetical protein